MTETDPLKLLFVCLGNICRSPTAHGIFEGLVAERGLDSRLVVDSAGTGDWHIGRAPDPRTRAAAQLRGYELGHLRARQVTRRDFDDFDYILAMDYSNLEDLKALRPRRHRARLDLFLNHAPELEHDEVPDPYSGGPEGFVQVLDMCEQAAQGLLEQLIVSHGLR